MRPSSNANDTVPNPYLPSDDYLPGDFVWPATPNSPVSTLSPRNQLVSSSPRHSSSDARQNYIPPRQSRAISGIDTLVLPSTAPSPGGGAYSLTRGYPPASGYLDGSMASLTQLSRSLGRLNGSEPTISTANIRASSSAWPNSPAPPTYEASRVYPLIARDCPPSFDQSQSRDNSGISTSPSSSAAARNQGPPRYEEISRRRT